MHIPFSLVEKKTVYFFLFRSLLELCAHYWALPPPLIFFIPSPLAHIPVIISNLQLIPQKCSPLPPPLHLSSLQPCVSLGSGAHEMKTVSQTNYSYRCLLLFSPLNSSFLPLCRTSTINWALHQACLQLLALTNDWGQTDYQNPTITYIKI